MLLHCNLETLAALSQKLVKSVFAYLILVLLDQAGLEASEASGDLFWPVFSGFTKKSQ